MDSLYRKDEGRPSGEEEYMENADSGYYGRAICLAPMVQSSLQNPWPYSYLAPLNFTTLVSNTPLQKHEEEQYTKLQETMISTEIAWAHEGYQVAIEGSWDNWSKREYLQESYRGLTIMKVLPVGVYYYLFFVDGKRTFAPDLPYVSDYNGNMFNILNLQVAEEVISYPCPASMVQSSLQNPWPYHYLAPLNFATQVSITPLQKPEEEQYIKLQETVISTEIIWTHEGHQVAIEGSWDNWSKREYLQEKYGGLTIIKVLPVGVYYYLFFVDGNRTFAPDLPHVSDDNGNMFNILDLQINTIRTEDNTAESESSPLSSYNNEHFSLKDFRQRVPELPPLLQSTPLNQYESTDDPQIQEAPLTCVLNHLFIRKPETGESLTALGSTQCFGQKYYVTDTLQVARKVAGPENPDN